MNLIINILKTIIDLILRIILFIPVYGFYRLAVIYSKLEKEKIITVKEYFSLKKRFLKW